MTRQVHTMKTRAWTRLCTSRSLISTSALGAKQCFTSKRFFASMPRCTRRRQSPWANRIFPSNSPDFFLRKNPVQPRKIPVARTIRHNHRPGHKVHGCVRDRRQLEKCSCSVRLQTCNPLWCLRAVLTGETASVQSRCGQPALRDWGQIAGKGEGLEAGPPCAITIWMCAYGGTTDWRGAWGIWRQRTRGGGNGAPKNAKEIASWTYAVGGARQMGSKDDQCNGAGCCHSATCQASFYRRRNS